MHARFEESHTRSCDIGHTLVCDFSKVDVVLKKRHMGVYLRHIPCVVNKTPIELDSNRKLKELWKVVHIQTTTSYMYKWQDT